LSKLFFKKSRLIRFPIDIRGKRYIDFGINLTTGKYCRIEANSEDKNQKAIIFGKNIEINDFVHITGFKKVIIEDNVLIASKVYISDTTHGNYSGNNQSNPDSIVNKRQLFHKPVKICRNVWIGESVSILPGVEIGENSIVGANSVVTKSFPCNVIIAGNPAKIIKRYNFKTNKWERTNDKGDFINE